MKRRIDKQELMNQAEGQWLSILRSLGPDWIEPATAGRRVSIKCQVHGGGADGKEFSLFPDAAEGGGGGCFSCGNHSNGIGLLMWLNGWDFITALKEIDGYLNGSVPNAVRRQPADRPSRAKQKRIKREQEEKEDAKRSAEMVRLWEETVSIMHPDAEPARRYLTDRGLVINNDFEDLRFHPACEYFEYGKVAERYPAIVSMFRSPTRLPILMHRTYLSPEGTKANVELPRKMMPKLHGRAPRENSPAIWLDRPTRVLNIAEGLETALAVRQFTGVPTFSVTSTAYLPKFQPPEGVRVVTVWADRDPSGAGEKYASIARHNLAKKGFRVFPPILPPDLSNQGKADWNDTLLELGVEGIRNSNVFLWWQQKLSRLMKQVERQPSPVMMYRH